LPSYFSASLNAIERNAEEVFVNNAAHMSHSALSISIYLKDVIAG